MAPPLSAFCMMIDVSDWRSRRASPSRVVMFLSWCFFSGVFDIYDVVYNLCRCQYSL